MAELFAPDDTSSPLLAMQPPKPLAAQAAPVAAVPTSASLMIAPRPAPVAPRAALAQPAGPVSDLTRFAELVRMHESGGNDKASSGVANGRYQFTPATWNAVAQGHPELGLRPDDVWVGEKQDLAMRAISQDYINVLHQQGIPPSMPNMFMLHFLGEGGGPKFLKAMAADPNASAPAMFPLEAKYNPTIFHDKAGQPRTLQQVYALMTKSFGGPQPLAASAAPAAPASGAAPAPPDNAVAQAVAQAAPQTVTDAAMPPLPAGLKLDPINPAEDLKVPPPPPGLKLDYTAADPITSGANPYLTKPSVKDETKPQAPPNDRQSLNLGADPAEDQARMEAMAAGVPYTPPSESSFKPGVENLKGIAAGAARDVTGPVSVLPNALGGGYAEDATKYLGGVGTPEGRTVGGILPYLVPVGGVAGAGKLGLKAIEEGGSLISPALKAFGYGAVPGLVEGSKSEAKGDTWGDRMKAKAGPMLREGAESGALSTILPGALAAGKAIVGELGSLGRFASDALGREAKKAAEELRTGVSAETGKALSTEEKKIAEATIREGVEKAKLAEHEAEIAKLEEVQQQIAERERVRAAEGRDIRQADDPKAAAELKSRVVTKMRERVYESEQVAKKAGLSAEEAKAFALSQEKARVAAEEHADKLTQEFKARPTTKSEEIGKQIHDAALEDMRALKEQRAEESGFNAAVNADKGQPSIPTKQFIVAATQAEKGMVSDAGKAAMRKLRDDLRTVTQDGRITAVSTKTARRIVQDLDSRIEGLNPDEAHEIAALKDAFVAHMEDVNKPLKKAREEYARLSRPLDAYRDAGAMKKTVLTDPYSGDSVVDSTKIVGALLNKTEGGADALGRLVAKNPELRDSARQYFNQQLFGPGKTPTAKTFERWLDDNRLALDRAGLTEEFSTLQKAQASRQAAIDAAKVEEKSASEAAKGADAAKKAALDKVSDERKLLETAKTREVATAKDVTAPEDVAKAAADKAKADAARVKEQLKAPEAAAKETERSISEIASARAKSEAVKNDFETLDTELGKARKPADVTGAAKRVAKSLKDKQFLDQKQYGELLDKIYDVEQKTADHAKAARIVKQILIAAAVAAVGVREVGSFVSHRVTP